MEEHVGEVRRARRRRVLSDHRQQGSRFNPPLVDALPLTEVKWIDQILPEMFWLATLNDRHGWARGAALALALATAARESTGSPGERWFAFLSDYSVLDEAQQARIVEHLRWTGDLAPLLEALAPLLSYYPECPLRFLTTHTLGEEGVSAGLADLRILLDGLFDRTSLPALQAQANAVYLGFISGNLVVAPTISLARFPEVQNYPRTEVSRRVASAVRATVSMLIGERATSASEAWSRYFWNRGLELEPCEIETQRD